MKNYKEVELQAKNAPIGSYTAGCAEMGITEHECRGKKCEIAQ